MSASAECDMAALQILVYGPSAFGDGLHAIQIGAAAPEPPPSAIPGVESVDNPALTCPDLDLIPAGYRYDLAPVVPLQMSRVTEPSSRLVLMKPGEQGARLSCIAKKLAPVEYKVDVPVIPAPAAQRVTEHRAELPVHVGPAGLRANYAHSS